MPQSESVLELTPWPCLCVDAKGAVMHANAAAAAVFGELIEENPSLAGGLWSKENDSGVEQLFDLLNGTGLAQSYPARLRTSDGNTSSFEILACQAKHGDMAYLLQIFKAKPKAPAQKPPTQQAKESQAAKTDPRPGDTAAAQGQKLECALQLARTVALDFNNALTSILGHSSFMLSKIEEAHPWRPSLLEIEKSAERAAEIAQDLAHFSNPEKDPKAQQAGNINEVVRRAADVFRVGNPSATFDMELAQRLYAAHFDEAKIQQVFVKLIENSIQAVAKAGTVTLRTYNVDFTEPHTNGAVTVQPGAYICVEVLDTGCGIPPAVLPRIFEPFFTTKKESGHRGLGLAWVYGIVTNHGGSVSVSSVVGQGTTARVYLPAIHKVVRDHGSADGDLSGSATILMVDDEDLLLTLGETVLSSYGYKVLTANNGASALDLFAADPGGIDLVITDLVMPGMGGREVMERMRRVKPDLRVLCTTGYTKPGSRDNGEFLMKPFASQDLLRKVKQLLAAEAGGD